jgi:hypothetical protein
MGLTKFGGMELCLFTLATTGGAFSACICLDNGPASSLT